MTQNEHTLIAMVILLTGWQLVWHLALKHHSVTKRNIKELSEIIGEYF